MIQRIQTLYLLGAAILLVFLFFIPFSSFTSDNEQQLFVLNVFGLFDSTKIENPVFRVWPLFLLLSITLLFTLISIFLYKKRLSQLRLCIVNIVLNAGILGLMYYFVHSIDKKLEMEPSYSLTFFFPVLSVLLIYLAIKGITKDEKLIRSLDRLR